MEKEFKTCKYCGVCSNDNSHGSNCRLNKELKKLIWMKQEYKKENKKMLDIIKKQELKVKQEK